MKKEEFIARYKNSPTIVDEKSMHEILDNALVPIRNDKVGIMNLVVVMEEFMEAGQAISKYIRKQGDRYNLIEELADAYLCIKYAQKVCGISDKELNKGINVKLDRQEYRNKHFKNKGFSK